ncbi:YALI0A03927p [Yarrowia lipolytica CLIB122]|jgi:ATP-dependent DNA helicase PIF1|uniref:ATP-dependent DNA helicase n=2 Tax=Yarrowia lipolytica TaxID=4952 RepID=Q6CHW9_YARLI|nr:YALI0A03927p [Yarrowia lipolytica CLIB122]AOW00235.1 hypothetical protein YALI1_A04178g [Yarrowia lipolytica]KAJ8051350.1 PIF1-like helicase-domain-containing protein [Yarrowia lipolytica]QNP95074.1 ATP-dependent DNA helicase pfh1 [Yarrowia lipolytica]CAG83665.1 YALI0A03927p [Yarrowia lipolytica CLIB122]SEI36218.1 YALIA101S10e03664g1_1 [Yarrowia lipolytica]|eukprot:XP_499742.1 YALI0A03927p [Yarrowia lipolytica CLIB122]
MNDSLSSNRKRSASPGRESERQQRPRQDGGADKTAVAQECHCTPKTWWQGWTRDDVQTFVCCYQKEMQGVKEANPGLDRDALFNLQNQELMRLVKRDVVGHYKKLMMSKVKKQKPKEEKVRKKSEAPHPTTTGQQMTKTQQAARQLTPSGMETQLPLSPESSSNCSYKETDCSDSPDSPVTLTDEQQAIFDKVKEGQSLMFTGPAGTGKSMLIKEIKKWCSRNKINCALTAPTGLAAMNINGQTIYRWAGLGLMKNNLLDSLQNLTKNRMAIYNWYETDLLIIDEASQISASTFDKIDTIARHIRADRSKFAEGGSWAKNFAPQGYKENNAPCGKDLMDVPFGGMQVVCVGDFFQIAPICDRVKQPEGNSSKQVADTNKNKNKKRVKGPDYIFKSAAFQELFEYNKFCLTVSKRQEQGSEFSNMLEALRKYSGDRADGAIIKKYFDQFVGSHDGKEAVYLTGTNKKVSAINADNLDRLAGPEVAFIAYDYRNKKYGKSEIDALFKKKIRAEDVIMLKPGAQIIFLKNNPHLGLVNGHLGRVAFLMAMSLYQKYHYDFDVLYPLYNYFRGTNIDIKTLDNEPPKDIEKVIGITFQHPWCYYRDALVAIDGSYKTEAHAQKQNYDGMTIIPANPSLNTCLEVVIKVGDNQGPQSNKFFLVSTNEFEELDYSKPNSSKRKFEIAAERKYPVICRRTQLPLSLSWALTIHKAQGQTLRRTMVDMESIDSGQTYVALSRVRAPEDLRLVSFKLPLKLTDVSVHEFDKTLKNVLE